MCLSLSKEVPQNTLYGLTMDKLRVLGISLGFLMVVTAPAFASTVSGLYLPHTEIGLVVNGTSVGQSIFGPSFGTVQASYQGTTPAIASGGGASPDTVRYTGSGNAAIGRLGASASVIGDPDYTNTWWANIEIDTIWIDQITVHPNQFGQTNGTYQWQPTVSIGGSSYYECLGNLVCVPYQGPLEFLVRQYTREIGGQWQLRSQITGTPGLGRFLDTLPLPAIGVPINVPFNYGFAFSVAVEASNVGDEQLFNPRTGANFSDTVTVDSLKVLDSNGNSVPFTTDSASGVSYTSNGITPTPEPATFGGIGVVLVALSMLRVRRSSAR